MRPAGPELPAAALVGAAVTAALGYGIAVWLARVTEYGERLEEEQACAATGADAVRAR